MVSAPRLVLLRLTAMTAVAVSAMLTYDTLHPERAFCPLAEACERVRESALGNIGGVPTSLIGMCAFGGLFLLTLLPIEWARILLKPAGLLAALAGAGLFAYQALAIGTFCPLCLVADGAGLMAGLITLTWGELPRRRSGRRLDGESGASRMAWTLAMLLAVAGPFAWPREASKGWVEIAPTANLFEGVDAPPPLPPAPEAPFRPPAPDGEGTPRPPQPAPAPETPPLASPTAPGPSAPPSPRTPEPAGATPPDVTIRWSPNRVEDELAAGHVVFVDFTAEWCVSCRVNEGTFIHVDSVREAARKYGVVMFVADWTKKDSAIREAMQKYGRSSVPLYIVLSPVQGREPIVLDAAPPGLSSQAIIDAFEAQAPSRPQTPPPATHPAPVVPSAPARQEVQIVEYLNAYCAHCRATHRRLGPVLGELGVSARIRRVYTWSSNDFPLWARALAHAQGLGLEERLFEELLQARDQSANEVYAAARRAGLDAAALQRALQDPTPPERLVRDRDLARSAQLRGLPTLDIGRRRLMGEQSEAELREAVQAALPR